MRLHQTTAAACTSPSHLRRNRRTRARGTGSVSVPISALVSATPGEPRDGTPILSVLASRPGPTAHITRPYELYPAEPHRCVIAVRVLSVRATVARVLAVFDERGDRHGSPPLV